MAGTSHVFGYRETLKALKVADKDAGKVPHRACGPPARSSNGTRRGCSRRPTPGSAAGYRVYVRQRGVSVEQSLRKTTGEHPEFGTLQMEKALLPALYCNEDEVVRRLEDALDKVAARFNHGIIAAV